MLSHPIQLLGNQEDRKVDGIVVDYARICSRISGISSGESIIAVEWYATAFFYELCVRSEKKESADVQK